MQKRKRQQSGRKCHKFFNSDRFDYLSDLKDEFSATSIKNAKHETIANLANFSYDPENFDHLYRLSVHVLFLENIDSSDDFISLSSLKGLANLVLYPPISDCLCQCEVVQKILNCIKCTSFCDEFVINGLLLLATLKRHSVTSIDAESMCRLEQIISQLPNNLKNNARLNNLCQIVMMDK